MAVSQGLPVSQLATSRSMQTQITPGSDRDWERPRPAKDPRHSEYSQHAVTFMAAVAVGHRDNASNQDSESDTCYGAAAAAGHRASAAAGLGLGNGPWHRSESAVPIPSLSTRPGGCVNVPLT